MFFKDEVRRVGKIFDIFDSIFGWYLFFGFGLGICILGVIIFEKVVFLQEVDVIFINNLCSLGLYDKVWQVGIVFLLVQLVGVMGDECMYEKMVVFCCVNFIDGMIVEWSYLLYEFLVKVFSEIINYVKGINCVVYDISIKLFVIIEWE